MIVHFVEVTDQIAYGKFLLARLDLDEVMTPSAMPEADNAPLLNYGGRRRLHSDTTLVLDLQRGTGAAWRLEGGVGGMVDYLHQHLAGLERLVCPMYFPFISWLHEKGEWAMGHGSLVAIPRYLELDPVQYGESSRSPIGETHRDS